MEARCNKRGYGLSNAKVIFMLLNMLSISNNCGVKSSIPISEDGSNIWPDVVMNISATYNNSSNSILVTWEDEMNTDDPMNLTYLVFYSISVAEITLLCENDSVTPNNDNTTEFSYVISEDGFIVSGVTVNITVQVMDDFGVSNLTEISVDIEGDFAPAVEAFNLTAIPNQPSPAVTLVWNNAFDAVPPAQFELTYNGTTTDTTLLLTSQLQSTRETDYTHNVTGLDFFTLYQFTIVAIYNLTGEETQSTPVLLTHKTEQGAPDPVGDIRITFNESSQMFDTTTQLLTISVRISWNIAGELNGILQGFSLELRDSLGAIVHRNDSISPSIMSVSEVVSLSPFQFYNVTINATTEGGSSSASSSARSPEAVPSPPINVTVSEINSRNATVLWKEPVNPNGEILTYTFLLTNQSGVEVFRDNISASVLSYVVEMLRPFTNYSVTLNAVNSFIGERSSPVDFTTLEDIPTDIQELNVTDNATDIVVTWLEPAEPNGAISYSVTVIGQSLRNGSIFLNQSFEIATLGLSIARKPYSNYTVTVVPRTEAGLGNTSVMTIMTPEEAPSEVRSLNLTYNGTHFLVSWDEPLEPNGNLTYVINVTGVSLLRFQEVFDRDVITSEMEFSLEAPAEAYTKYTAYIVPRTGGGRGPESNVSIITPQQIPSGVPFINVSTNANGIFVVWEEPASPNGVLQYNVSLQHINLAAGENTSFEVTETESRELQFNTSVVPFSEYVATVTPFTTAGPGPSNSSSVITAEDIPSDILMLNLNRSTNQIMATWTRPAFPNGNLQYRVNLTSTDLLTGDLSIINESRLMDTVFVLDFVVRFYVRYEITVVPQTGAGNGNQTVAFFETPQGAPSVPRNLSVVIMDNSSLVVTWMMPLSPNGVVTYQINITVTDLVTNSTSLLEGPIERNDTSRSVEQPLTVEPHTQYTVAIVARTEGGVSDVVMESVTTDQGVSSEPQNLMVTTTNTSALVTWNTPADPNGVISSYQVILTNSTDFTETAPDVDALTTEANFTNLRPFANYSVRVQPFTNNDTIAGTTASQSFTTDIGIPLVPLSLSVTPQGAGTLSVSWMQPSRLNAPSVNYTVSYRQDTDSTITELRTGPDELSRTIANLQPFTVYLVSVQACNEVGCGEETQEMSQQTIEEAPSSPQNFSLSPLAGNPQGLLASWTIPSSANGIIQNYTVTCNGSSHELQDPDNQTISLSLTLSGLDPFTLYQCSVFAATNGGMGNASIADLERTVEDAPSAPRNFNLTNNGSADTLMASWDEPDPTNGIIRNFTIKCNGSEVILVLDSSSVDGTVLLEDLMPFTNYVCVISANTSAGEGPDSASSDATTAEAAPGIPRSFTATVNGPRSISLAWMEPAQRNGIIQHYILTTRSAINFTNITMGTSLNLDALEPFTEYMFEVVAVTGAGSGMAAMTNATTDQDAPSAPINVMATAVSFNTITVTWSEPSMPNGEIGRYNITYYETNDGSSDNITLEVSNVSGRTRQLTDLDPFTNYTIIIHAFTGAGIGQPSDPLIVQTNETAPSPPINVMATAVSFDTITITWSEPSMPNGEIRRYNITYYKTNDGSSNNITLEVSDVLGRTQQLMNLDPFTNYTIIVHAFTGAGIGQPSDPLTVQTNETAPSPPTNVMATSVSFNTITVTWSEPSMPNGEIRRYNITYYETNDGSSNNITLEVSDVSGRTRQLMNLNPFTNYTIIVHAFTGAGIGQPSDPIIVQTNETAPSPPTNVMATAISFNTITVTWSEPSMPNGEIRRYNITYYKTNDGSSNNISLEVSDISGRSRQLTDLDPFTNYTIIVHAFTGAGIGQPSDPVTVQTNETAPSAPTNVMATAVSFNSITVTWSEPSMPNGEIRRYNITYYKTNDGSSNNIILEVSDVSGRTQRLMDLDPFTNYTIIVHAFTGAGIGQPSDPVTVQTNETAPSPPTNVMATAVSFNSITVTWSEPSMPNGEIRRYNITYYKTNDGSSNNISLEVSDISERTEQLTGLDPFTNYTIIVHAFTGAGIGQPSDPLIVQTNETAPSAPINVMATAVSFDTINVTWSEPSMPNGEIRRYNITYYKTNDGSSNNITLEASDISGRTQRLMNLDPFTNYTIIVHAFTGAGIGQPSDPVIVQTNEAAPSPPTNVMATAVSFNSITVTWSEPSMPNGEIRRYNITYYETNDGSSNNITLEVNDVLGRTHQLMNLDPFTNYTIIVHAFTGAGIGQPSDPFTVQTNETAPSAPNITSATSPNASTILLMWTVPEMPNGLIRNYNITVNSSANFVVNSSVFEFTITGLNPFTAYLVTLSAITIEEGSTSSRVVTTDESTPGPVRNLAVNELNSMTIEVTWSTPASTNGNLLRYRVLYASVQEGEQEINITDDLNTATMYRETIGNLIPFTTYEVTVSAFTRIGEGDVEVRSVNTDPAASSIPTNVSLGVVNSTAVMLTWGYPQMPRGVIQGYIITYRLSGNLAGMQNITLEVDDDNQTRNAIIDGLLPHTSYLFMIRAYSFGVDPFVIHDGTIFDAGSITTAQAAPSAPQNFMLSHSVDNPRRQLQASWTAPNPANGIIRNYTVVCNRDQETNITILITDTTMMSDLLDNLIPFTNYTCEVSATTDAGMGAPSNSSTAQTDQDVPGIPRNLVPTVNSPRSISLTWMEPAVLNGEIQYYTITTSDGGDVNTTETSFTLEMLEPFTQYRFEVVAATIAGPGMAALTNARTEEDAPSPPTNVMATAISFNSITVTWSEPSMPNGEIRRYDITHYKTNDGSSSNITLEVSDVSGRTQQLMNLDPFTNYTIIVHAFTGASIGQPSDPIIVQTNETAPPVPSINEPVRTTSSSITLTWTAPAKPNGRIRSYRIRYFITELGPSNSSMVDVSGSIFERTLEDLKPFTNYSIFLSAITVQVGNESNVIVMTNESTPGDPPQNFRNSSVTATSVTLAWNRPTVPNGIITDYVIRYQGRTVIVPSDDGLSHTFDGLNENDNFTFTIGARTSVGEGPTVSLDVSTLEAAPSAAPNDLSATPLNATTLRVSWTEPDFEDQNGVLREYSITYIGSFDTEPREKRTGATITMVVLEGLQEFANYTIRVNASTSVGSGPGSEVTVRTPPALPGRAVNITNFRITSNTTASVSWRELPAIERNGEITGYVINLTNLNASDSNQMNSTSSMDLNFDLTGLEPFTWYRVQVAAMNTEGMGPFSVGVDNITLEGIPEAPVNLMHFSQGHDTVLLTWDQPRQTFGDVLQYSINYGRVEIVNEMMEYTDSTNFTLSNLTGNSNYFVGIRAETLAGTGPAIMINFMTPSGPTPVIDYGTNPSIVPRPKPNGDGVTPTSFTFEFTIDPKQEENGPVDKYFVIVQQQPSENQTVTTYYESQKATSDFPQYVALNMSVIRKLTRKRETEENTLQSVAVGGSDDCGPSDEICNGPLNPGSSYRVRYRLFTGDEFTDYPFVPNVAFATSEAEVVTTVGEVSTTEKGVTSTSPPPSDDSSTFIAIGVVAALIVVLVVVLVVVISCIMYSKKKSRAYDMNGRKKGTLLSSTNGDSPIPPLKSTDPSIIPTASNLEMKQAGGVANSRFQIHHSQPSNTKKVYLKDFAHHLQNMLEDSGYKFSEEYERVTEIGLEHAKEASLQTENRAKNRYTNILAYDHSRVKLAFVDDEPGSDYINASYIPGHRMRRAYIATQGPLPATFDDFWRMVWEQNTHIIVMLTQLVERGRTKCHRYWPGTEPIVYGDIAVEMLSEKEKEDWTIREFKLSTDEKRHRLVRHFQFTSWPDHGVPDNAVAAVDFVKTVRGYYEPIHGPIITHCSAGVGRTGCFIALDTLALHVKDYDWVDIFGLACEIRQHRNHMIQTEAQYVFIHKAMLEIIDSMTSHKTNTTGSHFSQGGYTSLFVNHYTDLEESTTQMSDYYGDLLSEETHM